MQFSPGGSQLLGQNYDDSIVPDVEHEHGEEVSVPSPTEPTVIDDHEPEENELTKWLKPRKRTCNPSPASTSSIPSTVPPEMIEPRRMSSAPSKSRFLEYPGLRLDPKCWLQKKKPKSQLDDLFKLSADVSLTLNQKEIIPPTYALPYPFWLRKC